MSRTGAVNKVNFLKDKPNYSYLGFTIAHIAASLERERERMGSRDKDPSAPHQPLLSSLVVRPSDSGGGGGGGSDYEPGEVRLDPAPYSRSDRFSDVPGYRIRAGSGSPVRRRNGDHRYSPEFDRQVGISRGRGYSGGRSPGRFRDYSPTYGRGRGRGGRFMGRGFDGPRFGFGPFGGGDGMLRNHTNVRPREGDWICPDPACGNLNFARREHCNNCNRFRLAPVRYPRRGRGYFGPPSHGPPRRFPAPPFDRNPGRSSNGYRSPPRNWSRDGPRELGRGGPPHPRYEGRFPDHRRERMDYPDEDFRERSKFSRPMPPDMAHRERERPISPDIAHRDSGYMAHRERERSISPDMVLRERGRDAIFNERKSYERERSRSPGALSSPLPPPRVRYSHDERERSRSPIRGGLPSKEYHRDMYVERAREERRARDRADDVY